MRRLPATVGALVLSVAVSTTALSGAAFGGVATAQSAATCGLSSPAFCETFASPAGTGNRSGQLNGTLWGVSHVTGDQNLSSPADGWAPSQQAICGVNQLVVPDNDAFVCNGQMVEGQDDNQTVTALTIYPKQPFDFAGRTGKVTFDVTSDSQGNHAAWPEFWMRRLLESRPFRPTFCPTDWAWERGNHEQTGPSGAFRPRS